MNGIHRTSVHWVLALLLALGFLTAARTADAQARVERNVVYGMYSGLGLLMDVYYPEKPNGYGIVLISGSGWTRELSLDATPLTRSGQEAVYGLPLVEAGYTVFNLNHRAAPRFRYPAPVEDVLRAVRFIRHHADEYGIDPAHIGAMGGSSGGHLVSMLGVLDGDGDPNDPSPINRESAKVQCVVARAAPADLRGDPAAPLFGFRDNAGREGTVELQQLVEASPILYVTPDDPPFLLIHGDEDPVVPFELSVQMHAALEAAGVEASLLRVPGGGHGARFESVEIDGRRVRREPENPPDYIGAMVEWFDRHLVGR
jgi:acetyl esterase/lipase